MSMRIERTIDVYLSTRQKILSNLAAGLRQTVDDIPGIGPARRKALMKHFKGLEGVRDATVEELAGVESMNEKAASEVYDFFHSREQ